MSELLPCPHCGHTNIGETWCDRRGELYLAGVHCNECFASCDSKETWNTRATTPTAVDTAKVVWVSNCVHCGRIVDTREKADGGDGHGCESSPGEWVCSPECWTAVVDGPSATTPTASELVEALRWYANEFNWDEIAMAVPNSSAFEVKPAAIKYDRGSRARTALSNIGEA